MVCRNMDNRYLPMLGPFARSISLILEYVEFSRDDKIESAHQVMMGNPKQSLGNFNSSFLLYHGVKMSEH